MSLIGSSPYNAPACRTGDIYIFNFFRQAKSSSNYPNVTFLSFFLLLLLFVRFIFIYLFIFLEGGGGGVFQDSELGACSHPCHQWISKKRGPF